ncbi:hypothetical protein [Streptomyces sp. NPDC086010]|uniref:hypothetical protein n=1 Tax=Streptomyces sp. NPDC086010 TaxID=3365745 RepID=UPI0037D5D026
MAKAAPAVIGVLTAPVPPTWWARNRHKAFLAFGLAAGFYLGIHSTDSNAAHRDDRPRPAHTTPAHPHTSP